MHLCINTYDYVLCYIKTLSFLPIASLSEKYFNTSKTTGKLSSLIS